MKIKKIHSQNRRDFDADLECEHCGHIEKNILGYDDNYFHDIIIPNMKCKSCNLQAPNTFRAIAPKYAENIIT